MALEYFDNRNKRTDVPLHVSYSHEQITHFNDRYRLHGAPVGGNWWKFTRRAQKTYSYVGLSRSAASRCAEEKNNMYTRPFAHWVEYRNPAGDPMFAMRFRGERAPQIPFTQADKYYRTVATVNVTRGDGELYSVQITVDESIVVYKLFADSKRINLTNAEYSSVFASVIKSGYYKYDE